MFDLKNITHICHKKHAQISFDKTYIYIYISGQINGWPAYYYYYYLIVIWKAVRNKIESFQFNTLNSIAASEESKDDFR